MAAAAAASLSSSGVLSPVPFDPETVVKSFYRQSIDGNGRSLLVSLLQKAVRRSDARLARYSALVLVGSQCIERVVTRLLVMVSEDIGPADPWLAVEVLAVLDQFYYPKRAIKGPSGSVQPWRYMRNHLAVRHFILALAERFALAEKSRLGDNCSHGYFKFDPEYDAQPAWLSDAERADSRQVLVPILGYLLGDNSTQVASFEDAMLRMGYLMGSGKITTAKLCTTVVSSYARREQQCPGKFDANLLRLMRALDRVRVLRSGGDASKGRCTLAHLFYLVWAIDQEQYVLPAAPLDPVHSVLSLYSQEQAEADFVRFIRREWREATLPAYVHDFHTGAASPITMAEWILREDAALQPRNINLPENAAAMQAAHDMEAVLAKRKVPKKTKAKRKPAVAASASSSPPPPQKSAKRKAPASITLAPPANGTKRMLGQIVLAEPEQKVARNTYGAASAKVIVLDSDSDDDVDDEQLEVMTE